MAAEIRAAREMCNNNAAEKEKAEIEQHKEKYSKIFFAEESDELQENRVERALLK